MNLNDLRALAPALPPTSRLQGAEVADVLSALLAVEEHGEALIAAAKDGPNAVAQLFHDAAVKHAADNGHPEPAQGALPVQEPSTAGPVAPPQPGIDYDKLAQAIARAQNQTEKPAEDTSGDTGNTPATASVI